MATGDKIVNLDDLKVAYDKVDINRMQSDVAAVHTSVAPFAPAFSTTATYEVGDYVLRDTSKYTAPMPGETGNGSVDFGAVIYRCHTAVTTAGAWTGDANWEAVNVMDELKTKAEADGYYEELTAGSAEQLISSQLSNDQEPYVFRTAGGSADIGNRKNESIVGGTICWNQLVQNGNFTDGSNHWTKSTGTFNVENQQMEFIPSAITGVSNFGLNSASSISVVAGHQYLVTWTIKLNNLKNKIPVVQTGLGYVTLSSIVVNTYCTYDYIIQASNTENVRITFYPWGTSSLEFDGTESVVVKNVMLFDLTQMFGSTIADYVKSLEQATAGAGVAWFRKLFPKPYYAYNAGELMSVKAAAMETVGFNQWDEEWEVGYIDGTTGQNTSSATYVRSKNYVPVFPNTQYWFKRSDSTTTVTVYWYDANKNFVGSGVQSWSYNVKTIPNNVYYMRFSWVGTTYNNNICINLSWSGYRNGEYEPYAKRTYPLDSSLELRGIPKLSADNTMYFDGDTYEPDGTVTRKYGIINLGTLTWNGTEGNYYAPITNNATTDYSVKPNAIMSNGYVYDFAAYGSKTSVGIFCFRNNYIWVSNANYQTSSAFTTAMSGVMLVYELATPTTEEAEPFQSPQIVDDFGTERFIDAAYEAEERDVEIPVGHNTDYMANLRDKLQHLPDLADGNGTYVVVQNNNQLSLTPLTTPTELPEAPTANGTYTLKVTVADGTPTYSWVSET